MPATTIQVDTRTHRRLMKLKGDSTFDETIHLLLDLVDPADLRHAQRLREKAYEAWQEEFANRIRRSRRNRRLF